MSRDSQHAAVVAAVDVLRGVQDVKRSQEAQAEYLADVGELVIEVAHCLAAAGVTWDDLVDEVDSVAGVVARVLEHDPAGQLEYALRRAVGRARYRARARADAGLE